MSANAELLDRAIARLDLTLLETAIEGPDLDTATTCQGWDLGDLLGHLEATAGAYMLWVSACVGGRVQHLYGPEELAAWNATMIARLPRRHLDTARPRWAELAADHLGLARAFPTAGSLVMPDGRHLSVIDHAGVAAIEWFVHDWDVRRTLDMDARPDPELHEALATLWDDLLAPSHGPTPTDGDPGTRLLRACGRAGA